MRIKTCDIWVLQGTHAIVIPTNLGWKKDGENVMGRGLARQAAERCYLIPKEVGNFYQGQHAAWHRGERKVGINQDPPLLSLHFTQSEDGAMWTLQRKVSTPIFQAIRFVELIFVPSKRLVSRAYLSWQGKSDLLLIRRALHKLKTYQTLKNKIAVPLIGAGNGGLEEDIITGTIKEILGDDDRFTMVCADKRRW